MYLSGWLSPGYNYRTTTLAPVWVSPPGRGARCEKRQKPYRCDSFIFQVSTSKRTSEAPEPGKQGQATKPIRGTSSNNTVYLRTQSTSSHNNTRRLLNTSQKTEAQAWEMEFFQSTREAPSHKITQIITICSRTRLSSAPLFRYKVSIIGNANGRTLSTLF